MPSPSSPTEDNQSKSKPASKRKINQKPRRSSLNDQQVRQPHQEPRRSSLDEQHPRELPYETSSPKKQASPPKSPAQQQKSNISRAQPPSPMSSVQMLDKGKGGKIRTQPPKSDNQHMPTRSNCGCNACIHELMVVKNQPAGPKAVFSKEFKEQVQKRKLYLHTTLDSHPKSCRCKDHMEALWCPTKEPSKKPDREAAYASVVKAGEKQGKPPSNVANIRQLFSRAAAPLVRDPRLRKQLQSEDSTSDW